MCLKKFRSLDLCKVEDLVNNEEMEFKGYRIYNAKGNSSVKGSNKTAYFDKVGLNKIYAECYIAKTGQYFKLVIERDIFETFNLKDKAIVLNTGKGNGKRCVPSVSMNGTVVALHRLFGIKNDNDHKQHSLNLITRENVRTASALLNNKNKVQVNVMKDIATGKFLVTFKESKRLISYKDQKVLRDLGYTVADTGIVNIYNEFETEVKALKAIKEYEDKFYKGYAYSVINDMRGRFDLKFQQLIMQSISSDDVIKTVLKDYANDAYSVHRYNLIPLCKKYGIQYNEGITLPNGDLINK